MVKAVWWVAPLLVVGVLYCSVGFPMQRRYVPLPAVDAPPSIVLRTYFAAVSANDKITQYALWAPRRRPGINSDHVLAVTGVKAGDQDDYPVPGWRQGVRVLMSFHVWFFPALDDPQQPTGTFYLVVRNDDDEPWRIWGAGAFV